MGRYLNTITGTITTALNTSAGRNLVTDRATPMVRALSPVRAFLVRLLGFSPLQLQAVAVRGLRPTADCAALMHRLHCRHALWQCWSWRPVKPRQEAKSKQF
jgi:hypothetical protein